MRSKNRLIELQKETILLKQEKVMWQQWLASFKVQTESLQKSITNYMLINSQNKKP